MILNSSTSSPISRGVLLTGSFGNGFWSQTSTWGTVVPVSLEDGDTPSEALERTERTLKVQLGYPEEDGPSIYPEPESADSTSQRVLDGAWNLLFTGAFLGNREALSPLVHGTLDTLPELDFFSIKSRIQVDLSSPAVAELTARRLGIPQDAHGRWALIQRLWASPRSAEDLRTVFARPEALRGEDRG